MTEYETDFNSALYALRALAKHNVSKKDFKTLLNALLTSEGAPKTKGCKMDNSL